MKKLVFGTKYKYFIPSDRKASLPRQNLINFIVIVPDTSWVLRGTLGTILLREGEGNSEFAVADGP